MLRSGERGIRFVVVTSNLGKAREFESIFSEYGLSFRIEPIKTPEIQAVDLRIIAEQSAIYAYDILREPVLVEDAGLFIDALNGFPGPFSSYVYKAIGIRGILKLMEDVEDRRARFLSVIAFYTPMIGGVKIFTGEVEGYIAREPRGSSGFGFDPIFIPAEGDGKTFAEQSVEEKNKLSHRARAARKFAEWMLSLEPISPAYE
ncbi:MAG: XTP/dITP diphosphatase [Aigarchaeota archaeon]|jgi:XTP/dITP diphosphohydrolase|nr:XTP/dITP diphosphatase [Candidatus Wolframiiraptor gerlachensis]